MNQGIKHPLIGRLAGWAEGAEPIVPFAPTRSEFLGLLKGAPRSPILAHPEAQRRIAENYFRSQLLGVAVVRGECPADLHSLIYRAAAGSPLAFALIDACHYALKIGEEAFAKFSIATQLEGFPAALADWSRVAGYEAAFEGSKSLEYIATELVAKGAPDAGFWLHAVIDDFDDPADAMAAIADKQRRMDQAAARRASRGSQREPARFKHRVAFGWLPMSFWTLTADQILWTLDPENSNAEADSKQVAGDISDLKFKSHCSKQGAILEKEFSQMQRTDNL